jgi:hypothetical protein
VERELEREIPKKKRKQERSIPVERPVQNAYLRANERVDSAMTKIPELQVGVNMRQRQIDCGGGKPGQAQVIQQASNPFYDA